MSACILLEEDLAFVANIRNNFSLITLIMAQNLVLQLEFCNVFGLSKE